MTTRFSFSVTDELFHHLESAEEPMGIQLDLRFSGHLDEQEVEKAVYAAMRRHPMSSVRQHPVQAGGRSYEWELIERADEDPVLRIECADDEAVEAARDSFYTRRLLLENAPPFRMLIVHHPEGDWLFFKMSQVVTDAAGAYRFLLSVMRSYAGMDDIPPSDIDVIKARHLGGELGAKNLPDRLRRARRLLEYLGRSVQLPTRIAPVFGENNAGLSFVSHTFTQQETDALGKLRLGGATLNDVLATVLHLAVERWNLQRNESSGRITLMNVMNYRPITWRQEGVGNFSLWVNVATKAADRRHYEDALRVITEQTRKYKSDETAGLLVDLLNLAQLLPGPVRKQLTNLMPLTGNFVVDTAVLNNLGRVPDIPDPAGRAGRITAIRFSSPTRMPMGVAVGVVTLRGELTVTFRYRRAQFDRFAAEAFRDNFLRVLDDLMTTVG
ncbi:MAG TPA: condensation domain-containing protein [Moraxellaceae bacterium]|nr:condensation domain-containing protein [Moraxellaceae bacterium]